MMKSNFIKKIIFLLLTVMVYACVPYSSNFSCENYTGSGRSCSTVTSNLDYSINSEKEIANTDDNKNIAEKKINDNLTIEVKKCDDTQESCIVIDQKQINITAKKETNNQTISSLSETLNKYTVGIVSPTGRPIVTQPKTVKITILPYVDSKHRLNMSKDVYLIIDSPRFVIGDYLVDNTNIVVNEKPVKMYKSINSNKNKIIVRENKSETAKIVAEIDADEEYSVIKKEDSWVYINIKNRKIEGWIKE